MLLLKNGVLGIDTLFHLVDDLLAHLCGEEELVGVRHQLHLLHLGELLAAQFLELIIQVWHHLSDHFGSLLRVNTRYELWHDGEGCRLRRDVFHLIRAERHQGLVRFDAGQFLGSLRLKQRQLFVDLLGLSGQGIALSLFLSVAALEHAVIVLADLYLLLHVHL